MPSAETAAQRDGTHSRRLRRIAAILALLLLLELAGVALHTADRGQPSVSASSTGQAAAAGWQFVVSSSVAAFPACTVPVPLSPGIDRCLVYTVHNPGDTPITVTEISIARVDAPETCPADNLDLGRTTFTGALVVPAGAFVPAPGVPIALRETHRSQDGCLGASFTFIYTGSARVGAPAP
jgi:hypothetical protein